MALGSTAREVFSLVVGDGAKILGAGLALGLAGAYFAGRAMQSILYGVRPMDPAVLAAVAGTMTLVAVVATLIPARRAAAVNPTPALNDH